MTWESVVLDGEPEPAFWEPWQPQIGQRVRVRLNGECPKRFTHSIRAGKTFTHTPVSHDQRENGRVGTMRDVCPSEDREKATGHFYIVDYDKPFPTALGYLMSSCYAAIELEPA